MKRVAFAAAGLALVVGVIVLRDTGGSDSGLPTAPPPPTKLKPFAADQVLVPSPQSRPSTPANVVARGGHHKIQLNWSGDAPAYEVRWGARTKLVTRPGTQLNGLANEQEQQIEIRGVDSFGQRSQPARINATPRADNAPYTFVDRFDSPAEPDLQRWRLTKRTDCARATSGDEDDHDRLVISSSCGTRAVTLRSRTPFVRGDDDSRIVIETDAPSTGGRLMLDLVPGRSGAAYVDWLKARNKAFRDGIGVATLDPFHGYKNAIDDQLDDAVAVLDAFHITRIVLFSRAFCLSVRS